MKPEQRLRVTATGEFTLEQYNQLRAAIGSVGLLDSLTINTVRLTQPSLQPPRERPTFDEIPAELIGRLGPMDPREFLEIAGSLSGDDSFPSKLWNNLARSSLIARPDYERPALPSNLSRSRAGDSEHVKRMGSVLRSAQEAGNCIDLDALAWVISSGRAETISNMGLRSGTVYNALIQGRVAFIKKVEQQIDGHPT